MHYFHEDVARCFSEQAKTFSKELELPLNEGRELWARIHGCDTAHEATQKIKNQDDEFCEAVVASLRTLGRFPGESFVKKFSPFFRRGSGLKHVKSEGIDDQVLVRAALKAKGIPRRWSSGLSEDPFFNGPDGAQDVFFYELVNHGGAYLAIEGQGVDRFSALFEVTQQYRRQRRVKGVFLGFQEWINREGFAHNIESYRVFDVWTLKELETLFNRQLRRGAEVNEGTMWADRACVAAKSVLGIISLAKPDVKLSDLPALFNLDSVLQMREIAIKDPEALSPQDNKVVSKLSDFLWSLPGFTEEDCALGNLNPECYKQYGFLSMQFTSFIDSLTDENSISASNLFPDMILPKGESAVGFYISRFDRILQNLPDYSFVFIDIRRPELNESIVKKMIEMCKKRRIYAIWCGGASIDEQDLMQSFYDELFEVTEKGSLRPFF